MRSWTLHAPAAAAPRRASVPPAGIVAGAAVAPPPLPPRPDLVLVPEGFSVTAAILPGLWFLLHRMWIVFVLYLALAVLAALLLPAPLLPWLLGSVHLLIGFQAQDLRRWSLSRRGLPIAAVVLGETADAALLRALSARPELSRGMPA
jgi:hypothetical protein